LKNKKMIIRFPEEDARQAGKYAESLEEDIGELSNIRVERQRERADTQDFGATLVLVLGTSSITALASGLAKWLQKNAGARVSITTPDGAIVSAGGLESRDAAKIVGALSPHFK
jgi:hypothetical protein